jgi:hypothetical protein
MDLSDLSDLPDLPDEPQEESTAGQPEEQGSDELLAADDLRLPAGAAVLVRLHAVRAWLARRVATAQLAVGEAALRLQELAAAWEGTPPARRREREERLREQQRERRAQEALQKARERLQAYEEAAALLEEYARHSGGERVLVDYYLALSDLLESAGYSLSAAGEPLPGGRGEEASARLQVLLEVLRRVERVSLPPED